MCCRMTIVLSAATNPKGEWIKALSSLSGETVFVCFVVEAKVSKILKYCLKPVLRLRFAPLRTMR